jgi:uncharacterized protein (TIGR03435 family)
MIRLLSSTVLCIFVCAAQQQTKPPSFEVADIKPSNSPNAEPRKARILPGGRLEVPNVTLKELIIFAYGVQDNAITAPAKWMDSERFDLVAKAPADSSPQTLRPMLQSLLADRFKLALHREDKPMAAYVLGRGKRELKLQPASGGRQTCQWTRLDNGLRRRECLNMTMDELAWQLPGWGGIGIDRPVVNETGLSGPYDFQLDVGMPGGPRGEHERAEGLASPGVPDAGPTIFAAFEQVGLKLESRKIPVSVIVIDHAEPPAAN